MYSCKDITISEFFGDIVVSYKPLIVLLKYTISDSIAELIDKCIKSRFGGSSLPTTIKDGHGVISYFSNLVAMETYNRDVRFFIEVNTCISRLPVLWRVNSSNHLWFNFTHDEKKKDCEGKINKPQKQSSERSEVRSLAPYTIGPL